MESVKEEEEKSLENQDTIDNFDKASDDFEASNKKGNLFSDLQRYDEAIESFD